MLIKKVELIHYPEIKPSTDADGLAIMSRPEIYAFKVTADGEDGDIVVPNDPTNGNYQEVADWYKNIKTGPLKKKPFKFEF